MNRSSLLLVVGALVALVLTYLVAGNLLFGDGEEGRESAGGRAAVAAAPGTGAKDVTDLDRGASAVDDRSSLSDTPTAERSIVVEPVQDMPAPAASVLLHGRLLLPEGAPADETLAVVVLEALGGFGSDPSRFWMDVQEGIEPAPPLEFHRARVEADGSFEVALPTELDQAWIDVDGRYLGLRAPLAVPLDPHPSSLEFRPQLGGWIVGKIKSVGGSPTPPGELVEDEVALRLSFENRSFDNMMDSFVPTTAPIDEAGNFEFRAVPRGSQHSLHVIPENWAPAVVAEVRVLPGERTDLELELTPGATLAGRVLDETGAPAAGAKIRVSVQTDSSGMFFMPGTSLAKETTTEEDGTFLMQGAPTGEAEIEASVKGWKEEASEELELAEGAEVLDVELEVVRGNRVHGVVTGPDGTPYADAVVRVRFDRENAIGLEEDERNAEMWTLRGREETTDDQGRFAFDGLDEGPYLLIAVHDLEGDSPSMAFADNLSPDGEAVGLTLARTGHVLGVVRDTTGVPVTAFEVRVAPSDEDDWVSQIMGMDMNREFESSEGTFAMAGLPKGEWSLTVHAESYAPSEGIEVTMPLEDTGEVLEFELLAETSVAGIVLGPDGEPVPGARVTLDGSEQNRWMNQVSATKSDATGAFVLGQLEGGNLSIVASHGEHAPSDSLEVELAVGERLDGVVLTLRVGGIIEGQIFDDSGEPSTGRMINCMEGMMQGGRMTVSDSEGRFQFEHLPGGEYQLMSMPRADEIEEGNEMSFISKMEMTKVEVVEGEVTEVVLGMVPKNPVMLSGRLTAAGEPVPETRLTMVAEGANLLSTLAMVETDADGRFEVELKQPGAYVISAEMENGPRGTRFTFTEVVPESESHQVDLELPTGSITGTVFGPDGQPRSEARITLTREGPVSAVESFSGESHSTESEEDGSYVFEFLEESSYRLSASLLSSAQPLGRTVLSGVVVKKGAATTGQDFRLEEPGSIEGQVTDGAGEPVEDAYVFVRTADGHLVDTISRVSTDSDGHFAYMGLAPGEYTLTAKNEEQVSSASDTVRVLSGGSAEVSLGLELGAFLIVESMDGERNPVPVRLSILDGDGQQVNGMVSRDQTFRNMFDGFSQTEQRVGPLPPGRYEAIGVTSDGSEKSRKITLSSGDERRLKLRFRD